MQLLGSRCGRTLAAMALVALVLPLPVWSAETEPALVDINRASAAELAALPGIGAAKAQAIVDHRVAEPFESVEDLKKVQGIAERTFESLRSSITVSGGSR